VAGGIAGSPWGLSSSSAARLLGRAHGNRVPEVTRTDVYSRRLAGLIGTTPISGAALALAAPPPAAPPAPAPPPPPPEPPPSVERPIIAPASFPMRPFRSAGRSPRVMAPAAPRDGGVWAVSVGIDDYPGTDGDLRAAKADAREVDAALATYGVPANRRILLTDQKATAANIRGALAWLTAHASSDSVAVFFYSGHVRQVFSDPDHDGEAVDEAIVAADGNQVLDGEVANLLRGLEARAAWIGMAACFGAGFDDAMAPGRILTAAASESDLAYENATLGHSYLVEYMVRRAMLQGRAAGSVQDAFNWAKAQIARDYPNRQPAILDRSRGPVVLGRPTAATPERKPAPQPPPEPKDPQPNPSAPPPTAPEPKPGTACAQVLGVSVCSEQRS
jgi:Caspase domain